VILTNGAGSSNGRSGGRPQFKHLAFGWDGTQGEAGLVEPFRKAGFNIECSVVLTAPAPRPPARPHRR